MSDVDDDLRRAQALLEVGRVDEAAEILGRCLSSEPDSYVGHCLMANVESEREAWGPMLRSAQRAIAIRPEHEWGHRLSSIAHRHLLSPHTAVREAEEAVRLAPYSSQCYINLANCHLSMDGAGAAQSAYRAARKAVDLAPEEPAAHTTLGRAHAAADDSPSAQACYERALALDPLNSAARNNLAVEQLQAGRYTTAGRNLINALALDPHETMLQRNLLRSVHAWLLGRADIAALVWVGAWAADLVPDALVRRILYGLLAAALVVGVVYAYRRLPTVMRRLVRRPPSHRDPGRILAWICTVLPFGSLVLRAAEPDPRHGVVVAVSGLATVAVFVTAFRAYGRMVAAAERLQRRWAHRMFLKREGRPAAEPQRGGRIRLALIRWPVAGTLIAIGIVATIVARVNIHSEPHDSFQVGQCLTAPISQSGSRVVTTEEIVRCEDNEAAYRVTSVEVFQPAAPSSCTTVSQALAYVDGRAQLLCLSQVRKIRITG